MIACLAVGCCLSLAHEHSAADADVSLLLQIAEAFLQCGEKERDELLYYLIAHHTGRTLVFTNAISGVGVCSGPGINLGTSSQDLQQHVAALLQAKRQL